MSMVILAILVTGFYMARAVIGAGRRLQLPGFAG